MNELPAIAIETPDECMYTRCPADATVPMIFPCDGGEEHAVVVVCARHEQAILLAGEDMVFKFIKRVRTTLTGNACFEGGPA